MRPLDPREANPTRAGLCFMGDGQPIAREVERCRCGAVLGFCAECSEDRPDDVPDFAGYVAHWREFHGKH